MVLYTVYADNYSSEMFIVGATARHGQPCECNVYFPRSDYIHVPLAIICLVYGPGQLCIFYLLHGEILCGPRPDTFVMAHDINMSEPRPLHKPSLKCM